MRMIRLVVARTLARAGLTQMAANDIKAAVARLTQENMAILDSSVRQEVDTSILPE